MDQNDDALQISVYKPPPLFTGGCLEIRLFYVRIAPCAVESLPDHLILRHLRRELGVFLEINGARVPSSEIVSITLRRDRIDKDSSEVTYVSTDSVRIWGPCEFEVCEEGKDSDSDLDLILCGSLQRDIDAWSNGSSLENDWKTGWSMDCYVANAVCGNGKSTFFQPKLGVCSPSIEVYVAGCCSGTPVILTRTVLVSPRRKVSKQRMLDAIPEDEEMGKETRSNGFVRQRKLQFVESDMDDYDSDGKVIHNYYSEEMYPGEDGQLSWFNSGVRVGVGIGLGMCLGVGIGVGLLMQSYQATTSRFRRRFF
ncbi:hypothetical protein BUALT_Bualt01G0232600 [Buddleja alternifolia]|uniref:Erythronate-4-phosphate dehydrogenase family protein n=1 Tax=Buddleja alternifolia TaxID=168488 RepID=A0AAV6YHW6_9LAMI|nr:hypothetical protein BUALT_Bualt01G0232600 [Buddleja alternifolia]